MDNLARDLNTDEPRLEYGRVVQAENRSYAVHAGSGAFTARRAFGCLTAPEAGDTVLLSLDNRGQAYILQILERDRSTAARIDAPGDLDLIAAGHVTVRGQGVELDAGAKSLRASAAKEIALACPGAASVVSSELNVHAAEGQIYVGKLAFVGKHLLSQWEKIRSAAKTIDQTVDRLVSRLGSSYRYVKDLDETNAGTQRTLVDGTHAVHSKNSVHTAEDNVKIDGEQIHLG